MTWEPIKALFRKLDESKCDSEGRRKARLTHPGCTLAEILHAQKLRTVPERILALRLLTTPTDSPPRAEEQDFVLALELAIRGEHTQAIEAYSRLISAGPPWWRRASLHFARGDSYSALGRYNDAIADYKIPLRDFDVPLEDELAGRWGLSFLLQESGDAEGVIVILRELVDMCTRMIEHREERFFFYQRALAHAALREFSKALEDCRSAVKAPNKWRQTEINGYYKAKNEGQPAVDQAQIEELQAAILAERNVQERERV
jgi:tetratricopeptide (TPR) repeat protein